MANDSATAVSDPGRAAEATVVDGVVTDQKCYLMSNGEFWGISRWNGKSDWGDRYTMTLVADAPPAVSPPAVSPPDAPAWWYCEPCDVRVASSLTHVCKPHAPAKAPDRSGCAPWCGMDRVSSTAVGREPGEGFHVSLNGNDDLEYCSPACRDAKLPPMEAKAPATFNCGCGALLDEPHLTGCPKRAPAPVAQQAKGHDLSMWCQVCLKNRVYTDSCEHAREARRLVTCAGGCAGLGLTHDGPVLARVTRRGPLIACEGYMRFTESQAAGYRDVGGYEAGILRDPKRPELLPRARLAVDWFDDCLPEAGR